MDRRPQEQTWTPACLQGLVCDLPQKGPAVWSSSEFWAKHLPMSLALVMTLLRKSHVPDPIRVRFCCRKLKQWRCFLLSHGKFRGWGSPTPVGASALGQPHGPRLLLPDCPQVTSWSKVFAHPSLLHSSQEVIGRAVEKGTGGHQLSFKQVSQRLSHSTSTYSHWPELQPLAVPSSSRGWEGSSLFWASGLHKHAPD